MFNKAIQSIKDLNYVKVTKENWGKIEDLFATKEQKIQEQQTALDLQSKTIQDQLQELETLRKYKENDDLVYTYEEMCKGYKRENEKLKSELGTLTSEVSKMDSKVQSVLSLESAYLQKIIQAESKSRYCPDYETKGDSLVEYYA